MADDDIPEVDIKARQRKGKAHVEVEVPMQQEGQQEKPDDSQGGGDKKQEEQKKDEEGDDLTIAGYKLGELVKAPLEPPDEKEVGKRSPKTE